ncbi:hypothetical protein W97_07132 [Coniosporium apollinis CBS 100218]|uniref:FAD-binding domain-containing protein n=1 Tax=Coniosporium apollinis (strain CBS 100218) TaxID=1168221 RepID=R7Z232_CONA1|nr:uncharacterized protein W97_07132 [Coniosporium apollinis CBS 100218]EON67986.1 hypothetical protein W97_07132 [Coniosporium apollinis CBS 100218]
MNGTTEHRSDRLKILVVGAGIGGLTAGLALRQQGHEVLVFEQSRFASEAGAAIHLAPNANGILRRLGIWAENFGANRMQKLTEYNSMGEKMRSMGLEEANKMWQHPWLLAHRIYLHDALKKAATSAQGKGGPVKLHTSSKVVDVDPRAARVTLADGSEFEGDIVLGADGVHSRARSRVAGSEFKPFCCGKSAFRFLIPRKAAQEDEKTSRFVQESGELSMWYGTDRRVIMYPTSNNEMLNFVCVHPEAESEAGDDWNKGGNLDRMLQVYQGFDPALLALLSKADPATLKVWKLLDMEVLPTWTNERLALLGDAAHPFLPHQGQGGAVAIEDAASLAVVLGAGTPREEIPDRLKLYERIRYDRANRIQDFSRLMGADLDKKVKLDMFAFTNFNFGHDEWDNSSQKLREWTWDRTPNVYWRMPIAFGPMPGPRQTHFGVARQATESTFTTASIKFKTSRTLLQNLFPRGVPGWRFKSPGTVAYASFSQTTLNKMEWLGGSGYNHLGLYIHGVEYEKQNGDVVSGAYMPILFENLTDPIVSGREELGMPKLYSSIDVYRRATSYRINTGWQGAMWGRFTLENLKEVEAAGDGGSISGDNDAGILTYRYMPAVGRSTKGTAEAAYPVYVPFKDEVPQPKPLRVFEADKASFKIDKLDWEALPTLHHVIERLAELPVYEVVAAKVVEGVGVPDVAAAQRVE